MSKTTTLKSAAGDVAEKTKSVAKDAAQTVKDQAHSHAVEAQETVAGEVQSVASALRTASSEMRDGSPQERAVGQLAGTLADVSDSIRDQDLGEMVTAATNFARRNPLVFLGSAAFLGFAAARFAKSSHTADDYQVDGHSAPRTNPGSHTNPSTPYGASPYVRTGNRGDLS